MSVARPRRAPVLRSFHEWSDLGYLIIKGSRHCARREDGVPLFGVTQVVLKGVGAPYDASDEDVDWQEAALDYDHDHWAPNR